MNGPAKLSVVAASVATLVPTQVPTHIPTAGRRYLDSLLEEQAALTTSLVPRVNALRSEAAASFAAQDLPTTRNEEWRFTDLSALTKTVFSAALETAPLNTADIAQFTIEEVHNRLVFVDGVYAAHLSNPVSAIDANGVVVATLAEASKTHAALIDTHLGRHAAISDDVFATLNTSLLQETAVVIIPRGVALESPLHLLFIATQKEVMSSPRCLVIAEKGSAATVVEDYVVLYQPRWQEEAHFTNAVSEIALAENAHVHHIRLQREGYKAFHIGQCAVSLARDSNYQSVSVALGGRISRYNLQVVQTAEGSHCALDGLTLIAGQQLADTHTSIDHAKSHGTSRQLHKCIVGGSAHAVFSGKIMVRDGAGQTDAQQSNRNLLLTGKARVDTKPQLEIFASDVKCTHGATVGQLDNDELFYLQSRGLDEAAARNLLTYAFGAEVIERIGVVSLRQQLEQTILQQTTAAL
jgi:Fe-S cluster assembly protein SufD